MSHIPRVMKWWGRCPATGMSQCPDNRMIGWEHRGVETQQTLDTTSTEYTDYCSVTSSAASGWRWWGRVLAVTAFIHQYSSPRVTLITINRYYLDMTWYLIYRCYNISRYHKKSRRYDMISRGVCVLVLVVVPMLAPAHARIQQLTQHTAHWAQIKQDPGWVQTGELATAH